MRLFFVRHNDHLSFGGMAYVDPMLDDYDTIVIKYTEFHVEATRGELSQIELSPQLANRRFALLSMFCNHLANLLQKR